MPDVKIGQVWADNDKRATGRYMRVYRLDPTDEPTHALVVACDRDGHALINARVGRIRLDRFRPTSTGYRLIKEAPDA